MRIDIFSDPICPWCFIGKRRLEAALKARADVSPTIVWRAFQLNPDMPAGGMPRQQYLAAKFGGHERARRLYEPIGRIGASVGIDFAFDAIQRTPNTVLAHLLIRHAQAQDAQGQDPKRQDTAAAAPSQVADAVLDGLFRAYFLDGRDIGDHAVLLEIGEVAGLPPADVEAFLDAEAEREAVLREDRAARMMGINGVPCFIVDGAYAVSGAQEPEAFFPLFDLSKQNTRVEVAEA